MDERDPPSAAMIQHLAQRLVDRYGRDAPAEAAQIAELLEEDGNIEQADVWTRVREVCRDMVAKPGHLTGKR